jgi:hypothetical protein
VLFWSALHSLFYPMTAAALHMLKQVVAQTFWEGFAWY